MVSTSSAYRTQLLNLMHVLKLTLRCKSVCYMAAHNCALSTSGRWPTFNCLMCVFPNKPWRPGPVIKAA